MLFVLVFIILIKKKKKNIFYLVNLFNSFYLFRKIFQFWESTENLGLVLSPTNITGIFSFREKYFQVLAIKKKNSFK